MFLYTANIYSGTGRPAKKCTIYKYLPYTLQCSVDVTVNQCLNFCSVLGAAI